MLVPMAASHAFAIACLAASNACAQISFRGLGDLSGGGFLSEVFALNASGSLAAGGSVVAGSGFNQIYDAFVFDPDSGLTPALLGPTGSARAFALSANGAAVVGVVDYGSFSPLGTQAFLWTSQGTTLLGDLPGGVSVVPRSFARGVSADGSVIVGIGESDSGNEAWRYHVAAATFEPLGDLPGGQFASWAYGVSADGNTVVGQSYADANQQAIVWTPQGGMVGLGYLPTLPGSTPASSAEAANADGSVIVGWSRSSAAGLNGQEAFRWVRGVGMQPLGDLSGGAVFSAAYAVTPDGSVVVGRASIQGSCGPFGCGSEGRAFIWTDANGMRNIQELLADANIDLTGWRLQEARGVSADGRIVVGNGINPSGQLEAWMAVLAPPPCNPDYNRDGNADQDDVRHLIGLLGSANNPDEPDQDFNRDGNADQDDVAALVQALSGGGCP